jgi:hypothetical protein
MSGLMVQSKMGIKVCIITAVSERKCHSDRACFVGLVADVYSYPEDDTVEDPLLAEHLAHFGINFSVLTKVIAFASQQNLGIDLDMSRGCYIIVCSHFSDICEKMLVCIHIYLYSAYIVLLANQSQMGWDTLQTEMTTAERELDQNTNFDWNRIQEKGKELEPLFGPGLTGLANLGNR